MANVAQLQVWVLHSQGRRGNIQDGGKLITIVTALLAAFTGLYTSYAGSKAPVEHFTRGVAKELQRRGIGVNAVAPGPLDTPFFYPQESSSRA
ncbi:NAD(P)-binding domain protein [Metarhizium album ARSEF 1941]|uniref:NAD(P)-binding domain protein n=1 Tax=Metarhizium album (strain ARSEF 1941) TaxID=1081103 RepID=A0A0B2X034_METAS|nr:NAD(P)-binding domain protein [Metarhizium album ARSEF 1941]KHN99658.1 NAD(P)-binding domain protein [Metarhizium album ARSEF 1941]